MQWFQEVFGYREFQDFAQNQKQFEFDNQTKILKSKANNREFYVGEFETLKNQDLHMRIQDLKKSILNDNENHVQNLQFSHIIGDCISLIKDRSNCDAVFQVASQFNCLEMVGPGVTPQHGITQYCLDNTQGPKCALACPGATLYRNYFATKLNEQINLLKNVDILVQNKDKQYWEMRNGYCLPIQKDSMQQLGQKLSENDDLYQKCKDQVQVGIHWDTEVFSRTQQQQQQLQQLQLQQQQQQQQQQQYSKVCQVFTSALPVSYSNNTKSEDFNIFASLVLESAFDSVLAVAHILSLQKQKRIKVYLTAIGGGAFGNRKQWIINSIQKALYKNKQAPLDVYLVHYGSIVSQYKEISFEKQKNDKSALENQKDLTQKKQ